MLEENQPNQWPLHRHLTRRSFAKRLAVSGAALLFSSRFSQAQQVAKSIEGKVFNSASAPLPGAIVYLQDQKTNVIKTLIATADGSYHFGQLPADTDYRLWAEYKAKKSKVRLISSFDTKMDVTHDFHISD